MGGLCARTAVMGAYLNVKINADGVDDKAFVNDLLSRGAEIEKIALEQENEILEIVNAKIK